MGRSLKKGPFVDDHFDEEGRSKKQGAEKERSQNLVTSFLIFPSFIGFTIAVYDGRETCTSLHPRRHGRTQTR